MPTFFVSCSNLPNNTFINPEKKKIMKTSKKNYTTPSINSKKIKNLTSSILAASTIISGEIAPWGAKGIFTSFEEEDMNNDEYDVTPLY